MFKPAYPYFESLGLQIVVDLPKSLQQNLQTLEGFIWISSERRHRIRKIRIEMTQQIEGANLDDQDRTLEILTIATATLGEYLSLKAGETQILPLKLRLKRPLSAESRQVIERKPWQFWLLLDLQATAFLKPGSKHICSSLLKET
jgi:hypothetical protein